MGQSWGIILRNIIMTRTFLCFIVLSFSSMSAMNHDQVCLGVEEFIHRRPAHYAVSPASEENVVSAQAELDRRQHYVGPSCPQNPQDVTDIHVAKLNLATAQAEHDAELAKARVQYCKYRANCFHLMAQAEKATQ
jgi:hypothetical protein